MYCILITAISVIYTFYVKIIFTVQLKQCSSRTVCQFYKVEVLLKIVLSILQLPKQCMFAATVHIIFS